MPWRVGELNVTGAKGDRQHGAEGLDTLGPNILVSNVGFLGFGDDKNLTSVLMYRRVVWLKNMITEIQEKHVKLEMRLRTVEASDIKFKEENRVFTAELSKGVKVVRSEVDHVKETIQQQQIMKLQEEERGYFLKNVKVNKT